MIQLKPLAEDEASLSEVFSFTPCRWLATTNFSLGAGFYAAGIGPLPFAFGPVGVENYYAFLLK